MSDWSDKDTDNLFQRGSELHDFEYDPAAWQQMEKLLDRDRRRRLLWWWVGGALLLVLLFVMGKIWLGSSELPGAAKQQQPAPAAFDPKNTDRGDELQTAGFQNNQPRNDGNPATRKQGVATGNSESGESGMQEQTLPRVAGDGEAREAEIHPKPSVRQESLPQGEAGDKTKAVAQTLPSGAESGDGEAWENGSQHTVSEEEDGTSARAAGERGDPSEPAAGAALLQNPDYLALAMPALAFQTAAPRFWYPPPPGDEAAKVPGAWQDASAFLIGISGGPELNSVGFGDFSRLNWKFGVHAEHRSGGRFALSAGVNYIRMTYDAGKGEYKPTPPFWVHMIPPESTWGICDILEAPVGLSYFPGGYDRSGLFVTVGLASYFILREEYWYVYDDPDPDLLRWWKSDQDHNYWFGIGSVSVGYNRWLGRKLALRAAPYVQFPLTEIGHGHVKLYSLGLSLRLDFKLTR